MPENEKKPMPRSLYFTNGYMPKLADLRDAVKNNSIFHHKYNPQLEDPAFKEIYGRVLKKQPGEKDRCVDEAFEERTSSSLSVVTLCGRLLVARGSRLSLPRSSRT